MSRRLLREPLLHFALLGIGLFALSHWVADDSSAGSDQNYEIVITEGRIRALAERFEKSRQRPASRAELDGLVEDHIREEILYREGMAMGLDRDDTIVRRRIMQKIEFIFEDVASLEQPSEEELQAFVDAQPERFRQPSRWSFRQVYIDSTRRGASADADARAVLAKLRAAGESDNATSAGDPFTAAHQFNNATAHNVSRVLGKQFLDALATTEVGSWQGPLRSGVGLHLVHISSRADGDVPPLSEIREVALREWSSDKRTAANEAFYENLRQRYTITIAEKTTTANASAPRPSSSKPSAPRSSAQQTAAP